MTPIGDGAMAHLTRTLGEFDLIHPRYRIDGVVASGGMGTVYRALDRRLSREVAIKVLRSIDAPPEFAERLIREAAILGKLDHPGLVPVHDVGTFEDGRPFYVMRLVRGERLDRHLEAVPSLTERLRVFLKVAEPVAFAHAQGVVHRDLKPANIMVGPFGEVLVLDWGIAKIRGGDAEPQGAVLGTAGFMAPEQASGGSGAADERADVYALGAILGVILATSDRAAPRPLAAVRDRAMAERPSERIHRWSNWRPTCRGTSTGSRCGRIGNRSGSAPGDTCGGTGSPSGWSWPTWRCGSW
ncbi:MAG: serine/threonine-protein kinase [Gemmatimonadales bacterium]